MPGYRYQFCDLLTDQHIADLPLTGVRFDRRICEAGSFSATLPLTNATVADRAALVVPRAPGDLSTGPGRVIVHVWRNGQIWGSYILWSARIQADARGRIRLDLQGAGLESWLHRVRQIDATYTQVDQLDIARDMVDRVQADTGARAMGITTGGQASSGVLRDRTYDTSDYASVGKRLEELSEVINGPEWMIRTYTDAGARVREFYTAQVVGTGTVHRISQPGNLTDWSYSIDGAEATTNHVVRGGEDGAGRRWVANRNSFPYQDAGWPMLETVHDYPTATQQTTVEEYADWWRDHRSGSTRVMDATVRVPEDPTLTPDHLGDVARMVVVNPWWPLNSSGQPTFDEARRIVGMEIRPPEKGSSEEMQLTFEEPREDGAAAAGYGHPIYPPAITDMLARLPGRLREMISGSAPMG